MLDGLRVQSSALRVFPEGLGFGPGFVPYAGDAGYVVGLWGGALRRALGLRGGHDLQVSSISVSADSSLGVMDSSHSFASRLSNSGRRRTRKTGRAVATCRARLLPSDG